MSRRWLGGVIVLAMCAVSLATYSLLPDRVPTHWNFQGEVDGWSSRGVAAALMPGIALGVWLLFQVLPRLDPRRAHYTRFQDTYWLFANFTLLFLGIIQGLTIGYALGLQVNISRVMWVFLGLLFIVLGNYLPRIRSNWWMGIRTPWTLESDRVWRETHRVGGWSFVAGGMLAVLASVLPPAIAPWVAMAGLIGAGLVPAVYSYVSWRREHRETTA